MTVTSEISRSGPYNGNGATTVFPYDFKVFAATDLQVVQTDVDGTETTLDLFTDYTVDGVLDPDGGNVTLTVALPGDGTDENSQKLTIRRILAATQPMDLRSQGKINAEVLERAHDRAVMLIQQSQLDIADLELSAADFEDRIAYLEASDPGINPFLVLSNQVNTLTQPLNIHASEGLSLRTGAGKQELKFAPVGFDSEFSHSFVAESLSTSRVILIPDAGGTMMLSAGSTPFTVPQTIDLGSGALPAAIGLGGALLRLAQADGTAVRIEPFGYGNVTALQINARSAGGTRSVPLYPTTSSGGIQLSNWVYDEATAGWNPAASARLIGTITENHTATAKGFGWRITGTRNQTVDQITSFYLEGGASDPCLTLGIGAIPTTGNGLLQLLTGTTKAYGVALGTDTFLYRSAAGVIKTDGAFTIASTADGALTVSGKITAKAAVPGSFANLAAVQTYLASIIT